MAAAVSVEAGSASTAAAPEAATAPAAPAAPVAPAAAPAAAQDKPAYAGMPTSVSNFMCWLLQLAAIGEFVQAGGRLCKEAAERTVRHSVFPTAARNACEKHGHMCTLSGVPKPLANYRRQPHQPPAKKCFLLQHSQRVAYTEQVWICRLLVAANWLAVSSADAAAKTARLLVTDATGEALRSEGSLWMAGGCSCRYHHISSPGYSMYASALKPGRQYQ